MSECSICYDGNSDYKTLCKHEFHKSCLNNWYNVKNTCPLCRQSIEKPIFNPTHTSIMIRSLLSLILVHRRIT